MDLQDHLRVESKQHMQAGIALLTQEHWAASLAHFEEAVRLREQLPWQEDGQSAWLLAAAWINRSDALRGMGAPELLAEAVRSLDRTISAMGFVALAENPLYPERLILAWINRATACGEMNDLQAALRDFSQAESLLETWRKDETPARSFLKAMLFVNRARLLLDHDQPFPAMEDTRSALGILRSLNAPSAVIKACCIQCRALAALLEKSEQMKYPGDWIAAATDSVEEALALVKATGYQDIWVPDIVRYGARIYRVCQPQFLGEFLCEWLVDGPLSHDYPLREEMQEELLLAQAELEQRVLSSSLDTDYIQSQTRILKSLQAAAVAISRDF